MEQFKDSLTFCFTSEALCIVRKSSLLSETSDTEPNLDSTDYSPFPDRKTLPSSD
jgi:hypothetical protein